MVSGYHDRFYQKKESKARDDVTKKNPGDKALTFQILGISTMIFSTRASKRQIKQHLVTLFSNCYNYFEKTCKTTCVKSRRIGVVVDEYKRNSSRLPAIVLVADHSRAYRQWTQHQSILRKRWDSRKHIFLLAT